MARIRRAHRRWVAKRLAWLVPGFLLSCLAGGRIVLDATLSQGIRIPSLAIAAGILALLGTLVIQTLLVVRSRAAGDLRRSKALRRDLRPYRAFSLVSLAALLALAAIPFLFEKAPAPRELPKPRPAVYRPVSEAPAIASRLSASTPPAVEPEPQPPGLPQLHPEVLRLQELSNLLDEPESPRLPFPVPALPSMEERTAGLEAHDFPHRPGPDDVLYPASRNSAVGLDRGGLPDETDLKTWALPELRFDVMVVPESQEWHGAAYTLSCDIPVDRNESLRLTYLGASLKQETADPSEEPQLGWNRITLEYVRKLAGYTRHATFDLALRFGATVDRFDEHGSQTALDSSVRVSPWIGIETALWEQSGFGFIVQGGHSVATRITHASSSVTDLRALVQVDVSESLSFQVGYRIVLVRLQYHGSRSGAARDELDHSFAGPVAGFSFRF